MFKTQQTGNGDHHGRARSVFINRTGATLKRGQVAMEDWSQTQAESTNLKPGDAASIFANLTPVTQPLLENGFPVVVALEDIADNAAGQCLSYGLCEVAVLDDDVSTTDIDADDPISMLISESAVAVQAFANGDRCLGIALEAAAADSTDTDRKIDASSHLRKVFWTGGIPGHGMNLDA